MVQLLFLRRLGESHVDGIYLFIFNMVCRTWSQGRASQVHIGALAWLASWGMFPAHKKVSGNSLSCSEEPAHGTPVDPLGLRGKKIKSKAICWMSWTR